MKTEFETHLVENLLHMQDVLIRMESMCIREGLPLVFLVPVMKELDLAVSRYTLHFREKEA